MADPLDLDALAQWAANPHSWEAANALREAVPALIAHCRELEAALCGAAETFATMKVTEADARVAALETGLRDAISGLACGWPAERERYSVRARALLEGNQ